MLLADLKKDYPRIYERVVLQTNREPYQLEGPSADVNNCLIWNQTEEKDAFWHAVYYNRMNEAKEICPHLFLEEGDTIYKVVQSGLFKNVEI